MLADEKRMKRDSVRQITPSAAGRRSLECLTLIACALSGGCLAQPGDELIGRWEGRSEQQDTLTQAAADSGTDKKPGDKNPDGAAALETTRLVSLLDPFEFTIGLHFEDRQNVQMTFQAAERQESLRGTWSVLGRTGDVLNLEIVPAQPSPETAADSDADAGKGKGEKPASRRFKIVFSADDSDRFTLTEVDTGRQQGSIVFRRQKVE
jgi:hypothetical protein